ncbi:hypothetical protein FGM00_04040 [Aggregatimonas sangjinii]|uniref:Glycerophosphoryl diester phosphodiesterase membrane domain-containing protein n=1 Tax=Aggregatimonas sangjinii TaxID=2583587 RepID=A0A5B7SQR1_9FLAO|nr:hypothetical protein [Aggregatimonas sangjinii]QCW99320.1 hypothetical protein FGM00_04040 [Aggregatimonas sangjinii]
MTEHNYIEFKKKRELGDILSDTFAFMRNEFKPFFNVFFKIVGPFLAAMLVALVLYMWFAADVINANSSLMINSTRSAGLLEWGVSLFYGVSLLTVYAMSQSTVLHYIKSYTNGKGSIDFETIRRDVYASFWSFIGMIFLVAICLVVGFMLCCIPGIYLWVPLSLAFSIMVFDQMGVGDAFGESFKLVKDHWFITFATLLVMGIIVGIASYAFALPTAIYNLVRTGLMSGEFDAESIANINRDPVAILLSLIGTVAQFMLNIITLVAGAFIYFNLNEHKNFTGTYERIQNLGKTPEN